jgi:hypothetical protein
MSDEQQQKGKPANLAWLKKMADAEDCGCSVGGLACDLGVTVKVPDDDGFDPCEVERCIQDGKPMPSDQVIVNCIKALASDWLHYREAGLEIVASFYRERLEAIVEAMKNGE